MLARLGKVVDRSIARKQRPLDGLGQPLGLRLLEERAVPRPDLDEPQQGGGPERLAHRGPPDAERLRDPALRLGPVTRLEVSCEQIGHHCR